MPATMVLKVLVTGICAIVPSKTNDDLTRIIVPSAAMMHINGEHAVVPEHFAFLEVPEKNFHYESRRPDFKYHNPADPDQDAQRLVFILRSEVLSLQTAPTNVTHKVNDPPVANLTKPQNPAEETSTVYELSMSAVCPNCGPIRNDLFDLAKNPGGVAARLDIVGGDESVAVLEKYDRVWQIDGTKVKQPLAQEVAYKLDIPAATQNLILTDYRGDATTIGLVVAADNEPVVITLGNAPLRDILVLDRNYPIEHKRDDHFDHLYDVFAKPPAKRPLPALVPNPAVDVRTAANNCVPGKYDPQDPM